MHFQRNRRGLSGGGTLRAARQIAFALAALVAVALSVPTRLAAQIVQRPQPQAGQILGTVIDVNGDPVAGAKVVLEGPNPSSRKAVVTSGSGFFQFADAQPEIPYRLVIQAVGFAEWTSPTLTLAPGQVKLLGTVRLRIATQHTMVHVTYDPVKIATEQIKIEETQRILGIVPNFFVAYDHNAAPLTPKLKFQLALKVATSPVTFAGVAFMAAVRQAADSPNFPQGWNGYGERLGVVEANSLTDVMFGAAILPSLLHQDPRYFYQGTGTKWARFRHAILSPFICRGDNGEMEPNFSSVGGDLASAALSNLYYPQSNRGAGLVLSNFALGTGERVLARLAQEFLLARFTHVGGEVR